MNSVSLAKPVIPLEAVKTSRTDPTFLKLGIAEWFIISQVVLPGILFIPGTQPLRTAIRLLPFVISLLLFVRSVRRGDYTQSASLPWIQWGFAYLVLMIAHPTTNSVVSAVAQVGHYAALFVPIVWGASLVKDWAHFQKLILLYLVICLLNNILGLLQVWDSRFLPSEFTNLYAAQIKQGYLTFRGSSGAMVRPPGFSDTPGAVSLSGSIAILIGLVFFCEGRGFWTRFIAGLSIPIGLGAILVSQVRSALMIAVIGAVVYYFILFVKRRAAAVAKLVGVAVVSAICIATYINFLGGRATIERFESLTAQSPTETYQKNRGNQLIFQLENYGSEFPFGAGLGRWGMMHYYFGDKNSENAGALWAEMQFPAWLLDGGLIALICFFIAVVSPLLMLTKHLVHEGDNMIQIHSVFLLLLSFCGLMFSWVPFNSQLGLIYWFMVSVTSKLVVQRDARRADRP